MTAINIGPCTLTNLLLCRCTDLSRRREGLKHIKDSEELRNSQKEKIQRYVEGLVAFSVIETFLTTF